MAASPSRRPQPKGKMKTGICTNKNYTDPKSDQTGPCPKCESGEKMKIEVKRISDFRCPVCGGNLKPVNEINWKLWISLGAAAAILCLVLLLFLPKGEDESEAVALPASTGVVADSVKEDIPADVDETAEPAQEPWKKQESRKESKSDESSKTVTDTYAAPAPSSKTVMGGAAVMSTSGGYTSIKFKRSYHLDTGDSDHSTLAINPSDEIYMANVRNGILYGGQLKRGNGEEVALSGLKVRL